MLSIPVHVDEHDQFDPEEAEAFFQAYKLNQGLSCSSESKSVNSQWRLAAPSNIHSKIIQPASSSDSPNLPWTQSCNKINSYPSPVVTFQIDFQSSKFQSENNSSKLVPVHVMLDCGANVSFITFSQCRGRESESYSTEINLQILPVNIFFVNITWTIVLFLLCFHFKITHD